MQKLDMTDPKSMKLVQEVFKEVIKALNQNVDFSLLNEDLDFCDDTEEYLNDCYLIPEYEYQHLMSQLSSANLDLQSLKRSKEKALGDLQKKHEEEVIKLKNIIKIKQRKIDRLQEDLIDKLKEDLNNVKSK